MVPDVLFSPLLRFAAMRLFAPVPMFLLPAFLLMATAAMAQTATEAETVAVFDLGEMAVPEEFERVDPKSRMIEHEFQATADGAEDTARITMMAAGGDVDANINRWKGQFSGGNDDSGKVEEVTLGETTVHLVDINGTYADSMGGGPFSGGKKVQRKDYAMAGAIIEAPSGRKYFAKMVGPMKVVQANRERFGKMIRSLGK